MHRGRVSRRAIAVAAAEVGPPRRSRRHAAGRGDAGAAGRSRGRFRRRRRRRGPCGGAARVAGIDLRSGRDRSRRWQRWREKTLRRTVIAADVVTLDIGTKRGAVRCRRSAARQRRRGTDKSALQRSRAPSRLAEQVARDRPCRDGRHVADIDSRGAAAAQIRRRADIDLAGGRIARCAGGAGSRLRQRRNHAGAWVTRQRLRSGCWCVQ